MKKTTFTFSNPVGDEIFVYKWMPDTGKPKAIIQVVHGMVEHAGRYERFAESLIKEGYGVYANDHIGHGKTAKTIENVGYIPTDGFNRMVEDVHQLTRIIKNENKNTNVAIFGHSMGSYVTQRYIQKYGKEVKTVILSGTSGQMSAVSLVMFISYIGIMFKGEKSKAKLLNKLSFGNNNKKFMPNRTEYDWLSSDNEEVDKYVNDPYCGVIVTQSFFNALGKGIKEMHNPKNISDVPADLPLFLINGSMDPASNNVPWLLEQYRKVGVKDLAHKSYENARHEVLNEINRDEVTKDVIDWFNSHI